MKISAKCDYACRALLELASVNPEPLQIQDIADKQSIPQKYLVHILLQLKQAGIVNSTRGKTGGYFLIQHPANITLGTVMRLFEGPLISTNCLSLKAGCKIKYKCGFANVWPRLESAIAKIVDNVTFEHIVNEAKNNKKIPVYQI